MLPQTNATLLSVSKDGSTPDWDTPGSAPAPLWTGNERAYVQEKVRKNFSQAAGAMMATKDLQLVLPALLARAIGIDSGHVLTFTWRNQTFARRVMEYNGADMAGVPNYMRYHLNPESLEVTDASDE
jgi:hypothetical protein